MAFESDYFMECTEFEDKLSDYLERTLDGVLHKAAAAHVLKCPICHSLLNDVKTSLAVCREIAEPVPHLTRLEAKIIASTVPNASLHCNEFEEHLTDYLDGFLPAQTFHRWERHAVLCNDCTDLPGEVVRSLAALVTYKSEELPVPAGLTQRILELTIGIDEPKVYRPSLSERFGEWVRGIRVPAAIPQFAPVALMVLFASLFVSQTVSADGSLGDVYAKSVRLAEQTYRQSAAAWNGQPGQVEVQSSDPITDTITVDTEGGK